MISYTNIYPPIYTTVNWMGRVSFRLDLSVYGQFGILKFLGYFEFESFSVWFVSTNHLSLK